MKAPVLVVSCDRAGCAGMWRGQVGAAAQTVLAAAAAAGWRVRLLPGDPEADLCPDHREHAGEGLGWAMR